MHKALKMNSNKQTKFNVVNCASIVGDLRLSLMDNSEVALTYTFHFHGEDAYTQFIFSPN